MVYTMLKITFQKSELKQLICRNFYFERSKNDLLENVVTCDRSHDEFNKNVTTLLNKLVPKKKNSFVVTTNPILMKV